jgi:hypothetical protein
MKLSQPQLCFLAIVAEAPCRLPFYGPRVKTAESLEKRGLVRTFFTPRQTRMAAITDDGRQAYADASFNNRHED